MVWLSGLVCLFVVFALKSAFAQTSDSYSVEIDLQGLRSAQPSQCATS